MCTGLSISVSATDRRRLKAAIGTATRRRQTWTSNIGFDPLVSKAFLMVISIKIVPCAAPMLLCKSDVWGGYLAMWPWQGDTSFE